MFTHLGAFLYDFGAKGAFSRKMTLVDFAHRTFDGFLKLLIAGPHAP
jgi:hypothetical protein